MLGHVEDAIASIAVEARSRDAADRAIAEAQAYGVTGIEEKDGTGGGVALTLYAPASAADELRAAVALALGAAARVGPVEQVAAQDWSSTWREGIEAVVVSPRLAVRASFVEYAPEPGQWVLVIDPGQAFGTGHHASTRLALEGVERALERRGGAGRVLDVGTGSGVLGLAALVLGAQAAVGCDLDPVAAREATANARANGLAGRAGFFAGGLEALARLPFDLVVANLLSRELRPLLVELVDRMAPDGVAVLSGLLASERAAIAETLAGVGLAIVEERSEVDGGERWIALQVERAREAARDAELSGEYEFGVE
jgi:ribosomal protein L11 methyltransferase